jgi:hypothetical protein
MTYSIDRWAASTRPKPYLGDYIAMYSEKSKNPAVVIECQLERPRDRITTI